VQARWKTTFRALAVRNYRLFATGQLISLIGGWIQITAQDWLVLSITHHSPTALGFVSALQFAPVLLLSLYGGKLADRFDKRRMLIIANIAYGTLAMLMGILVVSGHVQVWHVFVFAASYGIVNSFETPARQSFVSELVDRELLPNALALSAATFNSARIIGPAIGGLTIASLGTGTAFIVNAVTFIAPVIAISRMSADKLFRVWKAGRVAADDVKIIDGLRYVRSRADLMMPIILMLVVGMVAFNFQITLALMARNVFHTGAEKFGLLTTCLAVGALFGALAGSARKGRPSAWTVLGSGIAFSALEVAVGFAPTFLATALVLVPTGFFMIFFAQATNQRVQMGTTAAFRGRVMALYVTVFLGTTPIGSPLVGWVSAALGPRVGIWLGGMIALVAALIVLAYELRRTGHRIRLSTSPLRVRVIAALPAAPVEAALPVPSVRIDRTRAVAKDVTVEEEIAEEAVIEGSAHVPVA
jgi:MFS family permease